MKSLMYSNKAQTRDELIQSIMAESVSIQDDQTFGHGVTGHPVMIEYLKRL